MNPYVIKTDGDVAITDVGREALAQIVTDPHGPVYAFLDEAPSLSVAAAMARLSRSPNDLRGIYLDEFFLDEARAKDFHNRVITGYGDDSVQQLMPIRMVVENASNLLTKKIERGRFLAYLEQSTRYIYFDRKINGRYRYYIPTNLPPSLRERYIEEMDKIFDLYSVMVRAMTEFFRKQSQEPQGKSEKTAWLNATRAQACDAVRIVLPVATTSTVGIVGSSQGIDNMIMFLASEDLQECTDTAVATLREVRKVAGAFFERTDRPERGGAKVAYLKQTRNALREIMGGFTVWPEIGIAEPSVRLVDYWPKDETDIVPDLLYQVSNFRYHDLQVHVGTMLNDDKRDMIARYIGQRLNRRHRPGRALEDIHYKWEISADYGTFRDLQRHRVVDGMEWQNLSPYFGYSIPNSIVEAGLEQPMEECFKASYDLHHDILNADMEEEAQYATLLGHFVNYKFTVNAREAFHIHELRTAPAGHPGYRRIVNHMHELVAAVHPTIAAGMIFVNKDEDPALTRMASELATQQKLALLENS